MPAERKYYFKIGLNAAPRNVFVRVYVKRTLSLPENSLEILDFDMFADDSSSGFIDAVTEADSDFWRLEDDGSYTLLKKNDFKMIFVKKRRKGIEMDMTIPTAAAEQIIYVELKGGNPKPSGFNIEYPESYSAFEDYINEESNFTRPIVWNQHRSPYYLEAELVTDGTAAGAIDAYSYSIPYNEGVSNGSDMFQNPFRLEEKYSPATEGGLLESQGLIDEEGNLISPSDEQDEQDEPSMVLAQRSNVEVGFGELAPDTPEGTPGDFEQCSDLEDPDAEIVCPECIPNESYSEPNIVNHLGSYYNEKTCEYVTVFEPDTGNISLVVNRYDGDVERYVNEHLELSQPNLQDETVLHYGLKRLALDFEKTQINGYFVGPVDELLDIQENPIEAPLQLFTRIEHVVIPDTGQVKVKLSVQKRYFELLPADESPDVDEALQAGVQEIEIDAIQFYSMILRARAGIKVYQKFYELHLLKEKGYLYRAADENKKPIFSVEFDALRRDLKTFRNHLFALIRSKGYKINSFNTSFPFANKKVDKIKIKFDNTDPNAPYKIKTISVKPIGCRYRQIYKRSRDSGLKVDGERIIFTKNPISFVFNPFAIIGNLNDVDDDLQAFEPPTWEEFFVKYLVPTVRLEYGTLNSPMEDTENSLRCAMDKFPNFGEFLQSSLSSLELVFELLAYEFNRISCAEDTAKALRDFNKRFADRGNLALKFKSSINPDSGIVSYLYWALSSGLSATEVIGTITFCQIDGLIELILECLLGGLPFDQALDRIVKKLIASLSARHIGKLISFLPASQQAEVYAEVNRVLGTDEAPLPWTTNFAGGASEGKKLKGFVSTQQDGSMTSSVSEKLGDSSTYALVSGGLANATPEQVEQMNVDSQISQVTNIILQAYIDALMSVVPIDDIITFIDKLPITPLIRTLIGAIFNVCMTPSLSAFSDIGAFLPKFKIDVCDPMLAVRIPKIPKLFVPSGMDALLKVFKDMLIDILIEVFTQLILSLLMRILKALDNILCQGLAALAREDGDFLDIFGSLLCDNDPEKTKDIIGQMTNSLKDLPPELAPRAADCISQAFSRTLSKREILLIAAAEPVDNNVYDRVSRSLTLACPEYGEYFPDGQSLRDLCDNFAAFIPKEQKDQALSMAELASDSPICDLICLNEEQLRNWNELRCEQLQDLGMEPDEACAEIDKLNDIALQEFDDLLSSGAGLQDIISDKIDSVLNKNDACQPGSPWNTKTPEMAAFSSNMAKYIFTPIENEFYREMTGKKTAALSMILSDTRGNSYVAHRNYTNSIFSRAYYKDFEDEESGWQGLIPNRGFFPKTIGKSLRDQITNYKPQYIPDNGISFSGEYFVYTMKDRKRNEVRFDIFPKIVKNSDISFEYNAEQIDYSAKTEFINSLNTSRTSYSPLENFGYTIRVIETDTKESYSSVVLDENISNLIAEPEILDGDLPYAVKYFDFLFKEKNRVTSLPPTANLYNSIFQILVDFTSQNLVTNDGFIYGAVQDTLDLSEAENIYVRPDNNQPYDHAEEEQILGIASPEYRDRILFLDPKVHGGTYRKPKIYIKPIKKKGWLSLYEAFENYDPLCDELNEKILPFDDIKKYHDDLLTKISTDKRLYQDPDCRRDIPFDRIYTTEVAAAIDGLVRMTMLCYAVDSSVNILPALLSVKWSDDNYDSLFSQIVFKNMKNQMLYSVGPRRTKNNKKIRRHRYWNLFMEQVVQAYQRQVNLGYISPTEQEQQALNKIFLVRKRYKYPDRNDIGFLRDSGVFDIVIDNFRNFELEDNSFNDPYEFYRFALAYDEYAEDLYYRPSDLNTTVNIDKPRKTRLKRFRLQTKTFAIRTVEDDIKILFNRILSQEIERYMEKINKLIPPTINNIKLFMFNKNKFFLGSSLMIGDKNSEDEYASAVLNNEDLYRFGDIIEPEYDKAYNFDISYDSAEALERWEDQKMNQGYFVVEKYIRINDKVPLLDNIPTELAGEQFFNVRKQELDNVSAQNANIIGVTKLKDFRNYLTNEQLKLDKDKRLSDYFGSIELGISPASFGIRVCYVLPVSSRQVFTIVDNDTRKNLVEKSYKRGPDKVVPLASYEFDFIDETIGTFTDPSQSRNHYDVQCLVRNLVKSQEFNLLFDKIFPIKACASLNVATLYTSFYNSIGIDDGWDEPPEGESDESENDLTDPEKFYNVENENLKATKKLLRQTFESLYKDQEYDEEESDAVRKGMFDFLKGMIPPLKLNLGKYGRRVVRDLDDCDDPVLQLLRDE